MDSSPERKEPRQAGGSRANLMKEDPGLGFTEEAVFGSVTRNTGRALLCKSVNHSVPPKRVVVQSLVDILCLSDGEWV